MLHISLLPGVFHYLKFFYLSGWIEKAGKMEYDKETSKKRISTSERG